MDVLSMVENIPEAVYYARHFRLHGFSQGTQRKLKDARVLVIGMGGLGCPAALYLAGAGVGTIALCDADDISATNLHRQILFDINTIGQKKVDVAAQRLRLVNPHICVETIRHFANVATLADLAEQYDLVIDGTDNFPSKYAISDACEAVETPLVYGSIFQFEGQVSVFHSPTASHPRGLSYRDLYPEAPLTALAQTCGEAGVIGVLPGIIGMMQANEAIKLITGLGVPLSGFLLVFDALNSSMQRLMLTKRSKTGGHRPKSTASELEISCSELEERLRTGTPTELIDVRDETERKAVSLGGHHFPLETLPQR